MATKFTFKKPGLYVVALDGPQGRTIVHEDDDYQEAADICNHYDRTRNAYFISRKNLTFQEWADLRFDYAIASLTGERIQVPESKLK